MQRDRALIAPGLDLLDSEPIEWLEPQVRGRVAAQNRREVNLGELCLPHLAIYNLVACELGAGTVCRIA